MVVVVVVVVDVVGGCHDMLAHLHDSFFDMG